MNSKELLEQAGIKVKRINELSDSIGAAEDILSMLDNGEVCFFTSGIGTTHLTPALPQDKMQKLREAVVTEIIISRNEKTAELEQLLGIQPVPKPARKPATINPEFEAATKDMFEAVKKPQPDPMEEALSEVLQKEEKRIGAKSEEKILPVTIQEHLNEQSDKSLDKYPASSRKDKLTDDDLPVIKRMYQDEGKSQKSIAAYYGIKASAVNTYLQKHKLFRGSYNKKADKQPEETERP